jgi:23S rRNA (adenine2503-C2)-methyltransferase
MDTNREQHAPKTRPDLKGMTPGELEELVLELGEPRYRAKQLASWVYEKDVSNFALMTNLPAGLRQVLDERAVVCSSLVVAHERSSTDATEKLLLEYADGARIEAVVLADGDRLTGCVSTQVGCRLGCSFCATGAMGLLRNLTAAEIVEEIMALRRLVSPRRLDNLVFMGMGEPLDNYDATLGAVSIVNAPWGLGVGARRMTISTAGLVDGIRRLAGLELQVNLAVSLNSADRDTRETIMPVARANPLPELRSAMQEYVASTGRMVTLEYVLLDGVNDSQEDADALAGFAKGLPCKINLICYNHIEDAPFAPPSKAKTERFLKRLRATCPTVVRRQSRGSDISAACGQLHASQS